MEQGIQLFRKAFIFTRWLQCHPYQWDGQKIQIAPRPHILLWALNAFTAVAYAAFVSVRCIQVNLNEEATTGQKIYIVLIAAFYFCAAWLQVCIGLKMEDIGATMRRHLNFLKHIKGKEKLGTESFLLIRHLITNLCLCR